MQLTFLLPGPQPQGSASCTLTAASFRGFGEENLPGRRIEEELQGLVCLSPDCEGRKAEWGKGWRAEPLAKVNGRKSSPREAGRPHTRQGPSGVEMEGQMDQR